MQRAPFQRSNDEKISRHTISQRACCTNIVPSSNTDFNTSLQILILHCACCTTLDTDIMHNHSEFARLLTKVQSKLQSKLQRFPAIPSDSVEQVATRNDLLQRLHRGSDDRLVSGHGDAFADCRHCSDGSRAHRVDKEPTISRPCRRLLMLCRTHFHTSMHNSMFRQVCAASLAACG